VPRNHEWLTTSLKKTDMKQNALSWYCNSHATWHVTNATDSQFTGKQASYLDTNQCYFDD